MPPRKKPTLAVWKFTSCSGCQLALLNREKELLALAEHVEFAEFSEIGIRGRRRRYDLSLVEGAVSTPQEVAAIAGIRRRTRTLMAMGACATAGGLQALRNRGGARQMIDRVYAHPEHIRVLEKASPISAHVPVDIELRGCPVDGGQLLEVIAAVIQDRRAPLAEHSLCMECKSQGRVCVMVAKGIRCLGPLTRAGCGAICPDQGRGCYSCYGLAETRNIEALRNRWRQMGSVEGELDRLLGAYNPSPRRGEEAHRHEAD